MCGKRYLFASWVTCTMQNFGESMLDKHNFVGTNHIFVSYDSLVLYISSTLMKISTERDEYKTYSNARSKIALTMWFHSNYSGPVQKLEALLNVL